MIVDSGPMEEYNFSGQGTVTGEQGRMKRKLVANFMENL